MLAAFALPLALFGAEPSPAAPAPEYRFELTGSSSELSLESRGELRITIHPRADKKVNLKAPLEVLLTAEGVVPDQTRLGPDDAATKTSSVGFAVGFRCVRPGPATLSVKAKFFICDERVCERRTEARTVMVTVREPGRGG